MYLKTYTPSPNFPAISLSGTACQLHCEHCDATYLGGMLPATTPEALLATCRRLRERGALGALLSGGSDRHGALLNLKAMLGAIRQAREETGLLFNLHPGLLDAATARALAVDFVSLELPSAATVRETFGVAATVDDYAATYHHLREAGLEVVPHVCVYTGDEARLLEPVVDPRVVVVIVFAPTRHTPMQDAPPPGPEAVGRVVTEIRARFPAAEIALGCMRPRARGLRAAIERAALDAGATRVALPSRATVRHAEARGFEVLRLGACCALPAEHESRALARAERRER